ncbi:MAG: cation diffusion facilitator family transporter [Elusimicrobiota bacterium]
MNTSETLNNEEKKGDIRAKKAYIPIAFSFSINILLFLLKLWAGILSGSVALIADAWHTVSDNISTAVVFVGFKITGKKPDKRHPFGHERAEKISGIIISIILFAVSGNFFLTSITRLIKAEGAQFIPEAMWILIFSVIAKEAAARYSISTGKKINSDPLIGDGWHHRSDAASSALILFGIFVGKRWWWIDGTLGLVIAAMLLKSAYKILKKTSSSILGEALSPETEQKLKRIVKKECPQSGEAHHFHLHSYGSHKELSFHITLPGDISLKEAHEIATCIEEAVRRQSGFEPTVHIENEETNKN